MSADHISLADSVELLDCSPMYVNCISETSLINLLIWKFLYFCKLQTTELVHSK